MTRGAPGLVLVAAVAAIAGAAARAPATRADPSVVLRPPAVDPGGIAAVVVDTPGLAPDAVAATFDGRALAFFAGTDGRPRALVGVALDTKAGAYPLVVEVGAAGAPARRLRATLRVRARTFPREDLQVPRAYVAPDAATLARIERERAALEAILARRSGARLWEGSFGRPADGPLGSAFGLRRFFNGEPRRPHMGQDLRVPEGTPVVAPARGRVVLADAHYFGGNTLVLDHGLGLFTMYLHLVSFRVREGTLVEPGELLGHAGRTGRVTGAHLHWAASLGGIRVDPLPLLHDPAAERAESEDVEQDHE